MERRARHAPNLAHPHEYRSCVPPRRRDKLVQDFVGVTGASAELAGKLIDSFDGNLEQAVTAYFDGGAKGAAPAGGAEADADEPMPTRRHAGAHMSQELATRVRAQRPMHYCDQRV